MVPTEVSDTDWASSPLMAAQFLDELSIVRLNAHQCAERVSKAREGAVEVHRLGLIAHLVHQVENEVEVEIKEVVLNTLHNTSQIDSVPALVRTSIPLARFAQSAVCRSYV